MFTPLKIIEEGVSHRFLIKKCFWRAVLHSTGHNLRQRQQRKLLSVSRHWRGSKRPAVGGLVRERSEERAVNASEQRYYFPCEQASAAAILMCRSGDKTVRATSALYTQKIDESAVEICKVSTVSSVFVGWLVIVFSLVCERASSL